MNLVLGIGAGWLIASLIVSLGIAKWFKWLRDTEDED